MTSFSYRSLSMWTQLSTVPTLLLFIFLPALIYEACMTTDYFVFSNHLGGSLLLAGPGMAIQVSSQASPIFFCPMPTVPCVAKL